MAVRPPFPESEFEALLPRVRMPGRYLGGEVNQVVKDPERVRLRWALIYPDAYEVGMAHLGLRILYHCLNRQPDLWAERCFAPWTDMEAELRRRGWPLTTLESRTPLAGLDVLGFTLQSELTYSNLLTCLDLGGLPLRSADRGCDQPLVVAGGAGTLNPEPLADFVDLFLLGDGEEAVVDFSRAVLEERPRHRTRRDLLAALAARCPYLYWPGQWRPRYEGPALAAMEAEAGAVRPRRAVVYDLENAPYPTAPVVPFLRTIHDRITIEIMRGCVQGCRFCQAGMEKRPQRFRSPEKILQIARASYRNTGLNEIGLTSLSSSDHPALGEILDKLVPEFRPERVKISLPSLRVDEQVRELPRRMAGARRQGLTLAPEVATDRLRRIVNKGIRDQDLFAGAAEAWRSGFSGIKLYFMIGIPGEEDSDVDGIVAMAERCSELRREVGAGGPGRVTASVATFVPKPLTPFQWAPQLRPAEVAAKQERLRRLVRRRQVGIKCHDSDNSLIEGFLSRADRRAGAVLLAAWRHGARFDAWSEERTLPAWRRAWEEHGYGPEETAFRPRDRDEILPWDHLDLGVSRAFLAAERDRAAAGGFTDHCQTGPCGDCGVGAATCVDIKALSGLFERFARPALQARARANPLLRPGAPVTMEPPAAERSRRRFRAAAAPPPASR
ncbi:MAG: TIGR03960 family B12-binding radical SAM protein [Planctomycetota bacterium]|nr:MAG: TIGR03960 family B12-binding radical SAM protein [Planctomycetota bacterium]